MYPDHFFKRWGGFLVFVCGGFFGGFFFWGYSCIVRASPPEVAEADSFLFRAPPSAFSPLPQDRCVPIQKLPGPFSPYCGPPAPWSVIAFLPSFSPYLPSRTLLFSGLVLSFYELPRVISRWVFPRLGTIPLGFGVNRPPVSSANYITPVFVFLI